MSNLMLVREGKSTKGARAKMSLLCLPDWWAGLGKQHHKLRCALLRIHTCRHLRMRSRMRAPRQHKDTYTCLGAIAKACSHACMTPGIIWGSSNDVGHHSTCCTASLQHTAPHSKVTSVTVLHGALRRTPYGSPSCALTRSPLSAMSADLSDSRPCAIRPVCYKAIKTPR